MTDLDLDFFYYMAEKCNADISMSHPKDGGTVWFNTPNFIDFCLRIHSDTEQIKYLKDELKEMRIELSFLREQNQIAAKQLNGIKYARTEITTSAA